MKKTLSIFFLCWALVFAISQTRSTNGNFTRNPTLSEDIRYAHWINEHSTRPKILFFGSSTMHGIQQTADTCIPGQFALLNPQYQVISFALDGTTPACILPVMQRAVHDGDYVIFDLIPDPKWLGDPAERLPVHESRAWSTPFVVLRGQVWTWLGCIPQLTLQRGFDRLKHKPKAIVADRDDAASMDCSWLKDELTEKQLGPVRQIAQLLRQRHAKAFVYVLPLNPKQAAPFLDKDSYSEITTKLFRAFDSTDELRMIDYNHFNTIPASDYIDGYHLFDGGCAKFAKILSDDWNGVWR